MGELALFIVILGRIYSIGPRLWYYLCHIRRLAVRQYRPVICRGDYDTTAATLVTGTVVCGAFTRRGLNGPLR
jgi:hypothetical protein